MPIISRVAENVKVTVDTERRGEKNARYAKGRGEGRMGGGNAADETRARLFSSPLTFRDTGDREVQDGMTLIRLITVIIRLRLAESKGVSRLGAPEKGRRRKRRGGKKNEREKGSFGYHDFLLKIRYSCLTKSPRGGMQTLPVRCDSLPCHVCALIRGQKEPGPWCTCVHAHVYVSCSQRG